MTETTTTPTPTTTPPQKTPFFIGGADSGTGLALVKFLAARGYPVIGAIQPAIKVSEALRAKGALPAYADPLRAGELRSVMTLAGENPVVVNAGLQHLNEAPLLPRGWQKHLPRVVEGTAALLEAAKAVGASFFIHVSYAFLYNEDSEGAVDENASLLNPREYENNPLLVAAIKAEELVKNSGLPYTILRAGLVYGADVANFQFVTEALLRGRYGLISEGDTFSNWIHANDLARAVLLAEEKRPNGEIFNIVDDEPTSPNQFVSELAERLGLAAPGRTPGLVALLRGNMTNRVVMLLSAPALNHKAKQQLGWTPQYATRATGFDEALLEWRAREAPQKQPTPTNESKEMQPA